ncbi:hypothetical protein ACVWZ4_000870 [Bradyrhizobium sp. USDA 4472]
MSWKSSWCIVANKGRTVQPEFQRLVVKGIGASAFAADSGRFRKLCQPDLVLDVIRKVANAVQGLRPRWVHRTRDAEPEGNQGDAKSGAQLQTTVDSLRTHTAAINALTATIINAQAALNWLSAQPPDLEEVRRALDAIANDGKRAGELVLQLRAPMYRTLVDDVLDP